MKSFQEVKIANFLFLHGVKYEYEKVFDENLNQEGRKKYRPDFYLPDYNISIEHFGIDEDGEVPPFFKGSNGLSPTEAYHKKMDFARSIHLEANRKLIETYSYEDKGKGLVEALKLKLQKAGVKLEKISDDEVSNALKNHKQINQFSVLISTFLTLFKSNNSTFSLQKKARKDKRTLLFLDIFEIIFEKYEAYLKENSFIDFADQINQATQYIKEGRYTPVYKYILVDEFQDMSIGRYEFLKSLIGEPGETKLYAVGDDWQSVFRFSGSDLSIMTEFSNHFGFSYEGKLEETHRFSQEILDYTSNFIQKNPIQIKKHMFSSKSSRGKKTLEINECDKSNEIAVIQHILTSLNSLAIRHDRTFTVLICGRYTLNTRRKIGHPNLNLKHLKEVFSQLDIVYLSAHKAKGKTFDYTILIEVITDVLGFPNELMDDPVLSIVLEAGDVYPNSEERRLFYVATTRARHKNYILTNHNMKSKFVSELEKEALSSIEVSHVKNCPDCGGDLVLRDGKHGIFHGCSNFPLCQ